MGTYVCLVDHKRVKDLPETKGWFEGKWSEYLKLNFDSIDFDCFDYDELCDDGSRRPKDIKEFREYLLKNLVDHERVNGMCDLLEDFPNGSIYFDY